MELSWSLLAALCALAVLAWVWYSSLRAREQANAAAFDTCQRTGAQLLDGTVAFRGLRPVRGSDGRIALQRTYVFDYSHDGVTRRQGFVILVGATLASIGLE